MAVSNQFEGLGPPGELWIPLKVKHYVAEESIGECPRFRSGFASRETLENVKESCAARLGGDSDQYRNLSHRTRSLEKG